MPTYFAKARVERVIREAIGKDKRISATAVDKLNELLVDMGKRIAKRAAEIAQHASRVTIQGDDIKLARETMK
jgi:histone H3/H4